MIFVDIGQLCPTINFIKGRFIHLPIFVFGNKIYSKQIIGQEHPIKPEKELIIGK